MDWLPDEAPATACVHPPPARRFNVVVNALRVATDFDIWAQQGQGAGSYAMLSSDVTHVNGKITIAFTNGVVGSPTITRYW
jgi:hypothetical protein